MADEMSVGVVCQPPNFWIAKISYEFIEENHVFTSDEIPGLLIISRDPKKAWRQIIPTIETLISKNHNVNCQVVLGKEFKEFGKKHSIIGDTEAEKMSLKETFAVITKVA